MFVKYQFLNEGSTNNPRPVKLIIVQRQISLSDIFVDFLMKRFQNLYSQIAIYQSYQNSFTYQFQLYSRKMLFQYIILNYFYYNSQRHFNQTSIIIKNRRTMINLKNQKRSGSSSANCTKRKNRVKRQFTEFDENTHDSKHNNYLEKQKQNISPQFQGYQAPKSCVDPWRQHMKYLIAENSEYFQSKIKVTDKIRPNQYRFKIPTKTPSTIYKKNFQYKQKNLSVDNLKLNRNNLSSLIKCKNSEDKFLFKTSYQNQFALKKQSISKHVEKKKQLKHRKSCVFQVDNQAPRFMDTQNMCVYLNWGGKNSAVSLKPTEQAVSTKFPLDGRTIYKNDFQNKLVNPTKIIVPQNSFSKFPNSLMINKSCYSNDFSKKEAKHQIQKSCKPQHIYIKRAQFFKGATQYRSEFINAHNDQSHFNSKFKTKEQLQALILDL